VPVGVFLCEHFLSNAFATNGPQAYAEQVKFLTGLPFVSLLEIVGIYIPLAYHALYGIYIWYRGEGNVGEYSWTGNWLYTAQRWTGMIAFVYMGYHTYTMRFSGVHLLNGGYNFAYGKVHNELLAPWVVAFYALGIVAASWHFAYGLFLFVAKWGLVTGERARRRLGYLCLAIGLAFVGVGALTLKAFVSPNPNWEWAEPGAAAVGPGGHGSPATPLPLQGSPKAALETR
jgi:succinate dehydrogenase / fumarate reductase cytochrome b subunit